MKTYETADVNLILEWVDKYFEVDTLISNIFSGLNSGNTPPSPSIQDEIDYQRLRFWFCKNHDKFLPIWRDFCVSKSELMEYVGHIEGMDYGENPFLDYYYPDNLFELAYSIGATTTTNNWDLDPQKVELIINSNSRFSYIVLHLKHWIEEFTTTVEEK